MRIDFSNSKIVAFYGYRTALVSGLRVEDVDKDFIETLGYILEKNGYKKDNHICWTTADGLSYMWSDRTLTIGTKLVVRNW